MRSCVACAELAATRTNVVVGTTPAAGAKVLLVGEAPGATEDQTGLPFVGRAGALLDELLAEVGLPRAERRGGERLEVPAARQPRAVEGRGRQLSTASWPRRSRIVEPRVICALGGTAAQWFFGTGAKIGQLRGRPHDVEGRQVVSTYHPSAAIRFGPAGMPRAALRDDLALVALLAAAP